MKTYQVLWMNFPSIYNPNPEWHSFDTCAYSTYEDALKVYEMVKTNLRCWKVKIVVLETNAKDLFKWENIK